MKTKSFKLPLIVTLLFFGLTISSCTNSTEKNDSEHIDSTDQTSEKPADSKVISDLSIYNLPSDWTSQKGEDIQLKDLKGKVLVVVMIYTTCKVACPRLVADMKAIEGKLPADKLNELQMVLVSIDPENDTPERLAEFAKERDMYDDPWLFLRGSMDDTRSFAAMLAVNYKMISPMNFTHSNIISVFNRAGEMVHQQEGLGVDNDETVQAIKDLL